MLKLMLAARNATINEVHFPAELGPSYVYASQEAIHEAVERIPRRKRAAARRCPEEPRRSGRRRNRARPRRRARRARTRRARRRSTRRSRSSKHAAARLRRTGARPAKPAKRRRRSPPAGSAAASRSTTRPGCPRAPSTSKATPTNTVSDPRVYRSARARQRRSRARRLPDGRWYSPKFERDPLLRRPGDPRLGRPADPRQIPSETKDDQRPRIRDLRRQRPDQDGRLAPRRKQLLGLQQTCSRP